MKKIIALLAITLTTLTTLTSWADEPQRMGSGLAHAARMRAAPGGM